MSTASPFEQAPPSAGQLIKSVVIAMVCAALILIAFILPAELGIDPTGIGKALGLTVMNKPARTLQIEDVIGGNEDYRSGEVADPMMDPVPLPNPAVAQIKATAPRTAKKTVTLEMDQKTEIKAVMDAAQVIVYSWQVQGGAVYTDFHGHEPDAGDAFVRYEEQQSGTEGHGSLVAPFSGEHGWFWQNNGEQPVTITLEVTGYDRELKDYGILQ